MKGTMLLAVGVTGFLISVALFNTQSKFFDRNKPLPDRGWKQFTVTSDEGDVLTFRCPVRGSHPYGNRQYVSDCYILGVQE